MEIAYNYLQPPTLTLVIHMRTKSVTIGDYSEYNRGASSTRVVRCIILPKEGMQILWSRLGDEWRRGVWRHNYLKLNRWCKK